LFFSFIEFRPADLFFLSYSIDVTLFCLFVLLSFLFSTGFARKLSSSGSLVNDGSSGDKPNDMTDYVATRWYRAPELLLGSTSYGKAVDMWAIACIMGELIDGQPLFPGETELDQLYIIQKMIGSLTPTQADMFVKNPRYVGTKLPFPIGYKPSPNHTLEKRYLGKLSKKALNFMKSILRMDENDRVTAQQAFDHPYFESLRKWDAQRITGNPNTILNSQTVLLIQQQQAQILAQQTISSAKSSK
jgi:serine/threonine protein kinase